MARSCIPLEVRDADLAPEKGKLEMEEDYRFKCLMFLVAAAIVGGASWMTCLAVKAFVIPTYHFTIQFFALYGRQVAMVVLLVVLILGGYRFHEKIVAEHLRVFDQRLIATEKLYAETEKHHRQTDEGRQESIRGEAVANEKLRVLVDEMKIREDRIQFLETEIERLKDPVAVATREAAKERLEGEVAILEGAKEATVRSEW